MSSENITDSNHAPTAMTEVHRLQGQLMHTISEMDSKIEDVIKQHEAQFLLAYRNHIKTMRNELAQMKAHSEKQQQKMMANQRTVYLQKQLILFREQALRLYEKLEEKAEENEMNRVRVEELEKARVILQKENRQLIKQNKFLQGQLALKESELGYSTQELAQAKAELQTVFLKQHKTGGTKGHSLGTNSIHSEALPQGVTPQRAEAIPFKPKRSNIGQIKPIILSRKYTVSHSTGMCNDVSQNQLQNWFLECLLTIRREVAQRKVYSIHSDNLNGVGSWQEFRMIDKLRLLQMFLQNEKLLVWMYQKIFPSRTVELQQMLSDKMKLANQVRQKAKSAHIQISDVPFADLQEQRPVETVGLKKKLKKFEIRSKIEMRNGKLNLSKQQ